MVPVDSQKIALQEWPIKRGGKNDRKNDPDTHADRNELKVAVSSDAINP